MQSQPRFPAADTRVQTLASHLIYLLARSVLGIITATALSSSPCFSDTSLLGSEMSPASRYAALGYLPVIRRDARYRAPLWQTSLLIHALPPTLSTILLGFLFLLFNFVVNFNSHDSFYHVLRTCW